MSADETTPTCDECVRECDEEYCSDSDDGGPCCGKWTVLYPNDHEDGCPVRLSAVAK